ncbi:hypothetical protein ACS0TY_012722 [Phlomoides rotata]
MLVGRSYTWYCPDRSCKSKIDRMLVNTEWLKQWPNQTLKGLRQSFSDHVPLVLQSGTKDWGPRPFRFMNSWLEHSQFKEFFQEKWTEYNIKGWAAYRLKEKLKLLKKDLREWNKVVFGNIDYNIDTKKKEIEVLDRIDDVVGLEEEEEIIQRNKNTAELIRFGQWKEKLLAQKAKARCSRLIPDKANLGFCFPCDGPGRKRGVLLLLMGGSGISYGHRHPSGRGYWQELIESIVWAHNKLKVAPATQPRALSIVQGRAVGVTHYLLGGIATTWAFFLARIIAVG